MAAQRQITTAACLIIGDEVLNGKTVDTNSAHMAKWCFTNGISLKRIETIEDDEAQIAEAVRRMSSDYDFVVTSGGIGPTHDDITYSSIANAFNLPLVLHGPTAERMRRLGRTEAGFDWSVDSPQRTAKLRMARFPLDGAAADIAEDDEAATKDSVLFVTPDLWVPVVVVNQNVHILPGVPRLFCKLLDGLLPVIGPRIVHRDKHMHRVLVTTNLTESRIAPYLTRLAADVAGRGIKVGSYPHYTGSDEVVNTVSLVGRDLDAINEVVPDVVKNVEGSIREKTPEP